MFLAGPVAINDAQAGMTLEIRVDRIRTGRWGWSSGPGAPTQLDPHLGLGPGPGGPPAIIAVPRGAHATFWDLDPGSNFLDERSSIAGVGPIVTCCCSMLRIRMSNILDRCLNAALR
jgi:hypothetical protein